MWISACTEVRGVRRRGDARAGTAEALTRAFSWYTSRNVRSPHPSGNAGNSTLASAFLTSRQISPNALAFALSHGPGTLNWREA